MDKRYQVFVSSTYADLVEERAEVMQALLELDCMPAGMELFPAANDDQWTWIKKVIDESDYYIVLVGGRYGSVSAVTGQSYTEMEYRYAIDVGKPIIAFLYEDPGLIAASKTESDTERRKKLDAFRALAETRLCKYWNSAADLGAKVSRSLTQLIKQYPAVGWVRASHLGVSVSAEEVLRLNRRIETLQGELTKLRTERPAGTEHLASGSDVAHVEVEYVVKKKVEKNGRPTWEALPPNLLVVDVAWDQLIAFIAPRLLTGADHRAFRNLIDRACYYYAATMVESKYPADRVTEITATDEAYRRIMIQLRALGLIVIDSEEYTEKWFLTPYGDDYMTKLLAATKAPNQLLEPTAPIKKTKRRRRGSTA